MTSSEFKQNPQKKSEMGKNTRFNSSTKQLTTVEGDIAIILNGDVGSPKLLDVSIENWGGEGDGFKLNTGGLVAPEALGEDGTDDTGTTKDKTNYMHFERLSFTMISVTTSQLLNLKFSNHKDLSYLRIGSTYFPYFNCLDLLLNIHVDYSMLILSRSQLSKFGFVQDKDNFRIIWKQNIKKKHLKSIFTHI